MMPDPTTVARRRAVPTPSAVMRRTRSVPPRGSAIAPRLVEPATQAIFDLVADAAKGRESLVLRPRHGRRVVEAPVQPHDTSREHRTALVRAVAHGDHVVPLLAEEAIDCLRGVATDVDRDLVHGANRERMHACGFGARAFHVEPIARERAEKSFGHLASTGVVRAEDQDAFAGDVHLTVSTTA